MFKGMEGDVITGVIHMNLMWSVVICVGDSENITNCKSDFLWEVTEIIIMMLSPDEEMKGTILTFCHRST